MKLDQSLLSDFARIVKKPEEIKGHGNYAKGTVRIIDGKKYAQIDGSNVYTPIIETVDSQNGDRVIISIENHSATILGNFTFPPSARKEQEALDKADSAVEGSNLAKEKAEEAQQKASEALESSSIASTEAEEAKRNAQEAKEKADEAHSNSQEAKEKADEANTNATAAKEEASKAQQAVANANSEIEKINEEIEGVHSTIDSALDDLYTQAEEIDSIKQTYSTKVETENVKAELTTEIETKVGELKTTVEENYSAKTDLVELEGKLQSQITQNAEGIASSVSKIEKLESDTEQAQKDVEEALKRADTAQSTADTAIKNAEDAKLAAEQAEASAKVAQEKAQRARDLADAAEDAVRAADDSLADARTALDEAQKNYNKVVNNPDSTAEEIKKAQDIVDAAQINVNSALEDVAEAKLIANEAITAAETAETEAMQAMQEASDANARAYQAKLTADKAERDAKKAQHDVAALTKRLTTAETKIEQNSEYISLTAKKTDEIGDELKNNYYSKTEFEAQFKIEAEKITSTVTEKVKDELGGAEPDNLLPNEQEAISSGVISNSEIITTYNLTPIFNKTVDVETGMTPFYTLSFEAIAILKDGGTLPTGQYYIDIDCVDPNGSQGSSGYWTRIYNGEAKSTEEWTRYTVFIKAGLNQTEFLDDLSVVPPSYLYFRNINIGNIDGATFSVRNIQITEGEEPKEWFDPTEGIFVTQSEHKSSIEQLSDAISTLVVDENGQSLMTQTSNGWSFNMGSVNDKLNDTVDKLKGVEDDIENVNGLAKDINELAEDLIKKTAYIRLEQDLAGNPCIILGKEDSDFQLRITNESIDFMEGTNRVAYASNNRFYAPQMVTVNSIQVGEKPGFKFEMRTNGNMGLVPIT